MGPTDLLLHLAGFVAPALALGLMLPVLGRLLLRRRMPRYSFWVQFGALALAGIAAMSVGLWWFGRDGKMATYGLLVLTAASVHWWLLGAWRR